MKVLLLSKEFPPRGSGIGNVVLALRNHMRRMSIHVDVLSQRDADINITGALADLPGLPGMIAFWDKAVNYATKVAPSYDLIWMHSPMLISAEKLNCIRNTMISLHTTYYGISRAYRFHSPSHTLPYYYFAARLERGFFRKLADFGSIIVTAVSPSVAEEALRNGLNALPQVIPNGLDLDQQNTIGRHLAQAMLRREFSLRLPKNARVLLYAGRIIEPKGILLLIDMFEQVTCADSHLHLIVAGTGSLLGKLRKKSARLNNVHILGHVPHEKMPILLSAAEAFISLSCYEGLPLTVLEAASMNIPLILSDIPAHNYIMNSGIGYGKLLNLNNPNPAEISEFMKCKNKRRKRIINITKQYKWQNVIEQYLRLI